jgi:hypothetical protein
MNNPNELVILRDFTDVLEQLDIAYAIGGSMASSIYGNIRFTQDTDVTVEPFESRAQQLFEMLRQEYYISKEGVFQALKNQSCFNIIHLTSAYKIDVFIRKNNAFEKQLIKRGRKLKLSEQEQKLFSVVSPEDIILLKLQWYQQGGCSSELQWNDVLGVLTIQKDRLDFEYLSTWADKLSIKQLLESVRRDAG